MELLTKYGLTEFGKDYAWFDCESFNEGEDYLLLFKQLCSISKGVLNPKNVEVREGIGFIDDKKYYVVEINFDFNDDLKTIKLLCEEWFDKDLIIELNKVLSESHIEKFCAIETNDQSLIIVFINEELKEKLKYENSIDNLDEHDYDIGKPKNFEKIEITAKNE